MRSNISDMQVRKNVSTALNHSVEMYILWQDDADKAERESAMLRHCSIGATLCEIFYGLSLHKATIKFFELVNEKRKAA